MTSTSTRSRRKSSRPPGSKEGDRPRRVDTARNSNASTARSYLEAVGPGLITGASDDDPSGIATYAQAGAKFGLAMLWAALVTLPLQIAIQEICDRTALSTGRSLGELIRTRFGPRTRIALGVLIGALITANALNIAADLLAIGSGMHLLHAGPTTLWAALAGVAITALLVTGSFDSIARAFKVLCTSLLSYIAVLFIVRVDWQKVLVGAVIPHVQFSGNYIGLLVGVLGTTISPYLFFWQSLHRLEELENEPKQKGRRRPITLKARGPKSARLKLRTSRFDVASGMTFSNIVMFSIIVATATTLGAHGQHDISTPDQAARALQPVAGHFASTIFALGFIGAGVLAVPVLAGAGSSGMAGLVGKTAGYSRRLKDAPVFYGLVAVGTIGGTVMSLFGLSPIKLLVLVAVLNGLAAAPFIVVVMKISSNRQIMGVNANSLPSSIIGWFTAVLMAAAAVGLFATGSV